MWGRHWRKWSFFISTERQHQLLITVIGDHQEAHLRLPFSQSVSPLSSLGVRCYRRPLPWWVFTKARSTVSYMWSITLATEKELDNATSNCEESRCQLSACWEEAWSWSMSISLSYCSLNLHSVSHNYPSQVQKDERAKTLGQVGMEDFNPGTWEQEHSQLFRQESLQPNTFTLDAQSSQAEHLRCTNYWNTLRNFNTWSST